MTDPTPDDYRMLHLALVTGLREVREACAAGAEDWEYQLLAKLHAYCTGLGIDRKLREPLIRMQMETGDRLEVARADKAGRPRAPTIEVFKTAAACAAVTVMKERGIPLRQAAADVEKLIGIPAKRILAQRNEFNREKGGDRLLSYKTCLTDMRNWDAFDRLAAYREL